MHHLSRRTLLGAAGALAAPFAARAQAASRVRFAMDWVWQGNHSIWTLAQERGLFAQERIEPVLDRGYGSADNLTKLGAGALDLALVDPNLLARFNAQNPTAQMTAVCVVYDAAPSALIFLNSSGIRTLKDLEGKRLAITEADATWTLFQVLCRINGVDLSKIEVINVTPQLRDTLVIQRRADASLGFFVTAVLNMAATGIPRDQIGYIQFNRAGLELYSLSLVCRKDYAAANASTVSGFVRGTIRGTRAMLADRPAAIASLVRRDSLLRADLEAARNELIIDGSLLTPWVRQNGMSTVQRERFERTTGQVAEALGVAVRPRMEDIYTDRFLPPQAERMIV
jgi:NitT/TauT family transport system substrate-binding protein